MGVSIARTSASRGVRLHGHQGRHQRVRPNRAQHHARRMAARRHRHRRGQRPDRRGDAGAPAQVRLDSRQPEGRHLRASGDRITVDGDQFRCSRRRIRRSCRGRTSASTSCSKAPAGSPSATTPPSTSPAGAKRVIITAPAKKPDVDVRHGRQPRDLRPGEAPDHLQRVVHDQLPRADRQGAPRDRSASRRAG